MWGNLNVRTPCTAQYGKCAKVNCNATMVPSGEQSVHLSRGASLHRITLLFYCITVHFMHGPLSHTTHTLEQLI